MQFLVDTRIGDDKCLEKIAELLQKYSWIEKVDVTVIFTTSRKTMRGKYVPEREECWIYLNSSESASEIVETVIHEVAHHLQYKTRNFKRIYGKMHNRGFWMIFRALKRDDDIENTIKNVEAWQEKIQHLPGWYFREGRYVWSK